jgi:hypothetical protein
MKNKSSQSAILVASAVLLAACATGPKHSEVASTIPALKAGEGRVYLYRSNSMVGAAIQPSILVNGKVVGDSKPGGFFFVDLPPGNVEVSTTTEVEKKATFTLERGQTRYVRTSPSFGILVGRIVPELVDTATGESELREMSYIGKPLTR